MEIERERGITIASAATHAAWRDHHINIIDTPGHVDFTIEVERSLKVLDGAVLVLCAVAGVQSQSFTVDRQMNRYQVPRLAFVNKCDRVGANPIRVRDQLREKLGHNAVVLQLPIGLEEAFAGVVDLIRMKAYYFEGDFGEEVVEREIPDGLRADADANREQMLDAVSMFSDELMEAILESEPSEALIRSAVRSGTLSRQCSSVRRTRTRASNPCSTALLTSSRIRLRSPTRRSIWIATTKQPFRSSRMRIGRPSCWRSSSRTDATAS